MKKRENDIIERFSALENMPLAFSYFPWFGVGFPYIDSRMSIYASLEHWAVVIQEIIVNQHVPGIDSIANMIYIWDNNNFTELKEPDIIQIASNGEDGEVFSMFDVNMDTQTMKIHGKIVPIPQSLEIYSKKNIKIIDSNQILAYELMRALTPEYRDVFFFNDDDILCKLKLDIPKLLQLDEWRHPIVYEDATFEYPARCEVFQLIAKAIESLDASLYKPTEQPNTHWSNWTANDYLL
jgi:hypothetical protein